MRLYPVLSLVSSALALAACGGGGGGDFTSGVASRANVMSVCTIQQTTCIPTATGGTPTTTAPDADGDGVPDDVDTDGTVGSGAGGNTANAAPGTRTLAIQASKLDKPTTGATAEAVITSGTTTAAATQAAILSVNKPTSLKFDIDTKSATNAQWAVPIEQTEFATGTRDLTWIEFNHVNGPITAVDRNGNPITYNPARRAFVYTVTNTFGGKTYNAGTNVDTTEDFYWNQLLPFMGTKANGGAMDGYREYRAIDSSPTVNRDEVLQVWAWSGDSYSAHYVNRDGEDPKQHAWTYGGNATTTPLSGSATYNGRFVGTAKTSNWTKPDGADVDPNANWRVQGRSELVATFGTNDIRGTLTPETWTSYQSSKKDYYTWYTQEAANTTAGNIAGTPSVGTGLEPNYYEIYDAQVTLNGKIKAPAGAPTGSTVLNNFDGTATLNTPYISSNNPMYGGFFGTNGAEATGVFSVSGTTVAPIGGSAGLNGDRAAYLDMNGSFNASCTIDCPD
jgi:C-lobe and N-lobe beta barrels of Tf-binding protein B